LQPPPQRSENHTSSATSGSSGPGGLSGMSGLGGLGGSRSGTTRPPARGPHLRGMTRSSVDRQGPPRSSMNDDSSGDNRRRSSSNQFPDSHQIFVGNVPLSAEENDLKVSGSLPFSELVAPSEANCYGWKERTANLGIHLWCRTLPYGEPHRERGVNCHVTLASHQSA